MALIILLDLATVGWLVAVAYSKGFANTLPIAAFLLMIFPVETRIQLPGLFDLTTQRVIVLVLCGLYLALGRNEGDAELSDPLPLRFLLFGLVAWMLVSSAESVVPATSFKSTLSQSFDFCTVYFIYVRGIRNREVFMKVLQGFVAGVFLCCIFGVIEIYADWRVSSLFPVVAGRFSGLDDLNLRGSRVQSTFGHAILFGAALAMAIPMTLYLLSIATRSKEKVYLWTAVALMSLCLYKTNSRGAWIGMLLSLVVLVLLGSARLRKVIAILVAFTVLVLVVRPGIRDSILSLYGATKDPDSLQGESYRWRYTLYHIAFQELARDTGRSLWGYGPESFYFLGLTTEFLLDGEMHTVKVESCDSAVVELMMDTGYVGLLLVAVLFGSAAVIGFRQYPALLERSESPYPTLLAGLVAFIFLMTNVELFGWGQQAYMLWIILAMMIKRPDEELQKTGESEGESEVDQSIGWGTWGIALRSDVEPEGH